MLLLQQLLDILLHLIRLKDITLLTLLTCFNPDLENQLIHRLMSTSNATLMVSRNEDSLFFDQTERRALTLVDLGCPDSERILNKSSNFRIFNSKYDWILFNSIQANLFQQGNDLKMSEHGKSIAESFTNTNPVGESRRASHTLTRSGLEIAESYLDKGTAGKTDTATETGSTESQLRKLMILPNSNVELVEFSAEQNVWQVFSLYKVRHNSSRMVKTLEGEGDIDGRGLRYYNLVNKTRRDNFKQEPVRIVEVLIYLDIFKGWDKKESMNLVDLYGWANHGLLQCLAFSLNASLVTFLIDDYGWKHTSEAGSFLGATGLIKFLSEEEADTGSALLLRNDRRVYVNYAATVFPVTTSFLFRQPSLASVSNIYVKTFSPGLWACTLVMLTFITVTLTILLSLSHRYGIEPPGHSASLPDVAMSVLGAICQQGVEKVPSSTSGRMTVLVTSMTCLFLVTSYAANIVALIQTPSSVINSVTDLADSPFVVKLHEFQHNRAFLRDVKKNPRLNREAKYLYDKKLAGKQEAALFVNASTGIEKIREPLYALLVALENFAYFYIKQTWREEEKCGLAELRAFPKNFMVLPVSKQSGYKELFAQKYILFREVGLIHQATQRWLGTKPECRSGTSPQFVSIGIIEFAPALKLYALGICVALLVFVGELIKFNLDRGVQDFRPERNPGETPVEQRGRARHPSTTQEACFRIPCA